MDRDYPIDHRPSGSRKYAVGLMVVGGIGLTWVAIAVFSFLALRLRSSVSPGVVVGYEHAGGTERLRIQLVQEGRPKGFLLLDAKAAWPKFSPNQQIEVLSWRVTNRLGQSIQQSMAYAHRNYWQKHAIVLTIAVAGFVVGWLGLLKSRSSRSTAAQQTTPPPLPGG